MTKSGFRGALDYYRALPIFLEQSGAFRHAVISKPSFFISGEVDSLRELGNTAASDLQNTLTRLVGYEQLPGVGHWPQFEAAGVATGLLLEFLSSTESDRSETCSVKMLTLL